MARFKLYVEYEGTRYSGWQRQREAKTIQGLLIESAYKIFNSREIEIQGSGRTDAGVHAIVQTAHLEVNTKMTSEIMRLKFNDLLPHDIHIIKIEKTNPNFHARHHAKYRSYIYQISKRRTAFAKQYVWWIKDHLSINAMQKAAASFIGMHDFSSFADKDDPEKSTKVLIKDVHLKESGDLILIRVVGSHFLWKMVRRMVGVLVEVGRGNMKQSDLNKLLKTDTDLINKYTAPPSGLFLENVFYEGENIPAQWGALINIKSPDEIKQKEPTIK